jgi:regulator of replication initiation timing
MRLRSFIIILLFLFWGADVRAQTSQGLSSIPDQWQLSLDVIKSKAQALVIENNGLRVEYRQLIDQMQKLQQSIYNQQYKNEQTGRFLKERHGRTDQQVRIGVLAQIIKTKSQEARTFDKQLGKLKRKQWEMGRKSKDRVDDQLAPLRKQLDDEITQEVLLKMNFEEAR